MVSGWKGRGAVGVDEGLVSSSDSLNFFRMRGRTIVPLRRGKLFHLIVKKR